MALQIEKCKQQCAGQTHNSSALGRRTTAVRWAKEWQLIVQGK
jgi:hypothetical protein